MHGAKDADQLSRNTLPSVAQPARPRRPDRPRCRHRGIGADRGRCGLPVLQPRDRHPFLHDVGQRARRRHPGLPAVRVRRRRCLPRCAQSRADTVPVFRFYNKTTGTHFYTSSVSERDGIIAYYPQFAYEGPAFHAMPADGTDGRVAVFRFFNRNTGAHFYTASPAERDKIVASYPHFVYEGVAFYVYPAATAAVAPVVVRSSDAWRFLVQTSFAPTPATLARVNQLGVAGYLEEQFVQTHQRLSRPRVLLPVARRVESVQLRRVAQQPGLHLRARSADAVQVPQPVLRQRDDEAGPAPPARGVVAVAVLRGVGAQGSRHGGGLRPGALSQDPVRGGVRQFRACSCGA